MNCKFVAHDSPDESGKRLARCTRCNWITPKRLSTPLAKIHNECRAWPFWHELGHWLAIVVAATGITKCRYNRLRSWLGYDKPCDCEAREEQYNGWGAKCAAWLASIRKRIVA